MFFQEILAVLADYLIYVFLMLVLAFRTYKAIHVHHSKTTINKLQFWVYTITLLVASLFLAINRGLYIFQAIATGMFAVMVVLEAKDLGRIEEKVKSQPQPPQKTESTPSARKKRGKSPEKKSVHPALKSARSDFLLTIVIAVLSFLNVLGVWNSILLSSF